jgi:hypothetical protein
MDLKTHQAAKNGDLWIVSIEKDFDVIKDQLW